MHIKTGRAYNTKLKIHTADGHIKCHEDNCISDKENFTIEVFIFVNLLFSNKLVYDLMALDLENF